MPRRTVVALLYPGALAMDVIGPTDAYAFATLQLEDEGRADEGYRVVFLARAPGPVTTISGGRLCADAAFDAWADPIDVLIVPGARTSDTGYRDSGAVDWLRRAAPSAGRVCSVCSGALVAAEAGVLSGRRATTHWMDADALRADNPDIDVEENRIFVRDGNVYSSGGVTAGIDLALAIIEEDFGRRLALKVAKRMIVFLKRPGDQNQFSELLSTQMRAGPFADAVDWIEANLSGEISVPELAGRCAMSPRNFSRRFRRAVGVPPIRYVEQRQLERSRRALEETRQTIKRIACSAGFRSEDTFRRAFARAFGVTPSDYRARFGLESSS